MLVRFRVRVEIMPGGLHDHLSQQSRRRELMKRVVNGRQRDVVSGMLHLLVQELGRNVPVPVPKQETCQKAPLTGGTQSGCAQLRGCVDGSLVN
jgi:hypothetical protein